MTSFTFMFVDVPLPVWKTSTGKFFALSTAESQMTRSAASQMASHMSSPSAPCARLARAAATLMLASALTMRWGTTTPLMGKLDTARAVDAP